MHKDKEGERQAGQFGGVHRLVFIVWLWFNQGRHTPSLRPPALVRAENLKQNAKQGGEAFLFVYVRNDTVVGDLK